MSGCYVIFHKQLGDLVLLEPTLSKLRDHFGEPVCIMTRSGHRPLLELMPGVEYHTGLAWRRKSDSYTFDSLHKSLMRALTVNAKRRHCITPEGHEIRWFNKVVFPDMEIMDLGTRYVAEHFWTSTDVPSKTEFRPPRLDTPPGKWRPDGFGSEPYILLNPSSGWPKKSWLPERWAEVLLAAHNETGKRVVLTSGGQPWQVKQCQDILDHLKSDWCQLIHTNLEQLLWICSRADYVFTVEGAVSHLAAAFGVPNLTISGPTVQQNWHYYIPLSPIVGAPPGDDGLCKMRNLSVPPVLEAVLALLKSERASQAD